MLPVLGMLALTNCASIVDGHNQSLSVKTVDNGTDVDGANCELTNDKGTWLVTTPGSVTVHRSYGALDVNCKKAGYQTGTTKAESTTKAMAFGNILFGGIIGTGVDMSTGAAYDYPALITVPILALGETPPVSVPAAPATSAQVSAQSEASQAPAAATPDTSQPVAGSTPPKPQ